MFTNARIKLTLWYFLMITFLTGSITGLFYVQTGIILEHEYDRIERRIQLQEMGMMPGGVGAQQGNKPLLPGIRRLLPEDLVQARQKILWQLLLINVGVIGLFTGVGYWWAGRTLAPIQAAHEAQQRFMADAAHELKTPLAAMKTSLEVSLMEQKLAGSTKRVLTENLADVKTLENLIQNLLHLSQVQGLNPKPTKLDLFTYVLKAKKIVQPLAEKKQIKLGLNQPKPSIQIMAQPESVMEIIVILLDNAIKYSPPKSQIEIKISRQGKFGQLEVSDQGYGMTEDQLAHIFDRFYRADVSRNKQTTTGFGLGLAIAKDLIKLQQGEIEVSSQVNQGSKFLIKLPVV